MLVGAAKHEGNQSAAVQQANRGKSVQDDGRLFGFQSDPGDRANLASEGRDEIAEHRRHQRAFLLGQPIRRVKEEIAADGSQAARSARARGIDRAVCCLCSDRPFLRHHYLTLLDDWG